MFILFFLAVLLQIAFLALIAWGLLRTKNSRFEPVDLAELPGLSVIIAAHNEAENLRLNLNAVLAQNYPNFEVVVVDHGSQDDTQAVLEEFRKTHSNLRVCSVVRSEGAGKKEAVTEGVGQARHDYVVFTDADCRPDDERWLQCFGQAFLSGADFALGTGFFEKTPSLLNRVYRLDAARIAMFYLAANALGAPYMAVARSMAYRKSLFDQAHGFTGHAHIPSGDDDLFLQSVSHHAHVLNVPHALTLSESPGSWRVWWQQKMRHMQAGSHYPMRWILLLGAYDLSGVLMWLGLVGFGFFCDEHLSVFYLLVFLRFTLMVFNLVRLDGLSLARQGFWQLFWAEFILSFWNPLLSITSQMTGRTEWRSRT